MISDLVPRQKMSQMQEISANWRLVQTSTWKPHRQRQLSPFPFNPMPSRRQFPDGELPFAQLLQSWE